MRTERVAQALLYVPATARQAAEALGVNEGHLSAVRNGRAPLTPKLAAAFERAYGIRAAWLTDAEGPMLDADHPAWATATTTPAPMPAVWRKTFYCPACARQVAANVGACPFCHSRIEWPAVADEGQE